LYYFIGAGILISAAIFEMLIEAEKSIGTNSIK